MQFNGEVLRKTGVNPFCIRLKALRNVLANWYVTAVKSFSDPETDGEGQRTREFAGKVQLTYYPVNSHKFTPDW